MQVVEYCERCGDGVGTRERKFLLLYLSYDCGHVVNFDVVSDGDVWMSVGVLGQGTSFWSVAQTRPGQEKRAVRNFQDQGIEFIQPLMERRVVVRGRRVVGLVSQFPNYLIVRMVGAAAWRSVLGTRGILRVLLADERPARLPQDFVDQMLARPVITLADTPPRFTRGQIVAATSGSFAAFPGEFIELTGEDRCKILFSMLGKPVYAEMRLDQVEAV